MARRKLSTGGRVLTAGLSVGIAAALAGAMAAGDHSAHASTPGTSSNVNGSAVVGGTSASPYDSSQSGDGGSSPDSGGSIQYSPQPHTRSGGS